jgi:hypothetical protein
MMIQYFYLIPALFHFPGKEAAKIMRPCFLVSANEKSGIPSFRD